MSSKKLPVGKIPSLSVIVILYNSAKYLRECLDSIINQTYRDFELILVDDGSTDGSGKICDEYKDNSTDIPIKVIHKKNKGMLHSRYIGIKNARCKYVTFVDSDDFIDRGMYISLMDIAVKSNCDMIMSKFKFLYPDGTMDEFTSIDLDEGFYDKSEIIRKVYPIMLWSLSRKRLIFDVNVTTRIMKREILYPICNDLKNRDIILGEDRAIVFSYLIKCKNFYYMDKSFYNHRVSTNVNKYIGDSEYFDRIYNLFKYLKSLFYKYKVLNTLEAPLDCLYIELIARKSRLYKWNLRGSKYLFPFGSVKQHGNIILYGAGTVGKSFFQQVIRTAYCNVILWTDRNYHNFQNNEVNVSPVESILAADFDQIVICLARRSERKKVAAYLMSMGINENKIVYEFE